MSDYLDALSIMAEAVWNTMPYVVLGVTALASVCLIVAGFAWLDGEPIRPITFVVLVLLGPVALVLLGIPLAIIARGAVS